MLEVGLGRGDQGDRQRERRQQFGLEPDLQANRDEQQSGERFDDRVPDRDRCPAVSA